MCLRVRTRRAIQERGRAVARAPTGGNLRARRRRARRRARYARRAVCRFGALEGRARRAPARWFFKDFRPGSRRRLTLPRLSEESSRVRELGREDAREDAPFALDGKFVACNPRPLCRSPRKRGGGPRVLGRAARLIEGPPSSSSIPNRLGLG